MLNRCLRSEEDRENATLDVIEAGSELRRAGYWTRWIPAGEYLRYLQAGLSSIQQLQELQQTALKQNITTLRNRVNELGVAEPIIQQQGADRVVVQLPGVA